MTDPTPAAADAETEARQQAAVQGRAGTIGQPPSRRQLAGLALLGLGALALPAVRWVLAGGIALAAAGVVLLLATTGQLANARNGFTATVVILVGIALATAPLWRRLLDQRAAERAAVIRSEERAAVAAHLHDSVLQTLALIQRHAEDPTVVGRLTRLGGTATVRSAPGEGTEVELCLPRGERAEVPA